MDKILKRIELLFSSYQPSALYLGFAVILVFLAIIVLGNACIYFIRQKKFKLSLFGIPSFFAIIPAVFSALVIASSRINIFICAVAGLISFLLNYYFVYFDCADAKVSETYLHYFGRDDEGKNNFPRIVLYGGLLLIGLFYLFSIDHNWVPPQYDVTSYQFIGDLLFRNRVYPVIPFAGDNTITILVPPGYFIYDFISRLIWNNPRVALLISVSFFMGASIVFVRLGSLFFETKKIESFVLIALLTRGFFWNAWEFNLLRFLSLIASLMFLAAFIEFYRAKNIKKAVINVFFAQLFFSSAILTHPEHCFYILSGIFMIIAVTVLLYILGNKSVEWKKIVLFLWSLLLPIFFFCSWYFLIVNKHASGGSYVLGQSKAPIPNISGLLFHFNGIIPIMCVFVGTVVLLFKNKKFHGGIVGLLFVISLILSYFQGGMSVFFPDKFQVIDFGTVNDFTSARYFVKTSFVHPDATISKMIAFWWSAVIVMGWLLFFIWEKLKRRLLKICFLIFAIVVLAGDVLFMYYNKPIIEENERLFLKNLSQYLPPDAVIIAPPGYKFSAWTGPLLHRDSLSNRAYQHTVNSLPEDIVQDAELAYGGGSFDKLFKKLSGEKIYILFNSPYKNLANRFINNDKWPLVYKLGDNYCFYYKEHLWD